MFKHHIFSTGPVTFLICPDTNSDFSNFGLVNLSNYLKNSGPDNFFFPFIFLVL